MRLLTSTLLSLGVCAFVLSVAPVAQAKPKKAVAHKTVRKAKTKSGPTAADLAPLVFFNADGSPRSPMIDDAPADDYQRVAWCHGILSGDMELAEQIGSLEPVDERIQTIGRSYLRAYEAALTLSGRGKSEAAHAIAEQARRRGYDSWKGARDAEIHKAAYAYDTWQLPGDCEHAAIRLSGHPNLFAEMATDEEAEAVTAALNSGGPHNYDELPKPILKAQTAPVDADAPIATNTLSRRASQSAALSSLKTAPAPLTKAEDKAQPQGDAATKPDGTPNP